MAEESADLLNAVELGGGAERVAYRPAKQAAAIAVQFSDCLCAHVRLLSPLAFDHRDILHDALERVRAKLEYTTLATTFLAAPFTITALRHVYEAIWGTSLDAANFQRKVLNTPGFIEPTTRIEAPGRTGGRPARLYNPGTAHDLHPALLRTSRS